MSRCATTPCLRRQLCAMPVREGGVDKVRVPEDFGVLVGWMGPRHGGKIKKRWGLSSLYERGADVSIRRCQLGDRKLEAQSNVNDQQRAKDSEKYRVRSKGFVLLGIIDSAAERRESLAQVRQCSSKRENWEAKPGCPRVRPLLCSVGLQPNRRTRIGYQRP